MTYKLIYSKQFTKDFAKLDLIVQSRILVALEEIQMDPYKNVAKLKNETNGIFRRRIGDYRIRFDILENQMVIYLYRVRHRKEVYRA